MKIKTRIFFRKSKTAESEMPKPQMAEMILGIIEIDGKPWMSMVCPICGTTYAIEIAKLSKFLKENLKDTGKSKTPTYIRRYRK